MTDEIEDVIQDIEPVADAESIAEEPKKSFSSDAVKKVVEREKAKAFERGKREALMELQQQQSSDDQVARVTQQQQQDMGIGGMPQLSQDDVKRMIYENAPLALQQQFQELQKQQLIDSFTSKITEAEKQYPGLESELGNLNYKDDQRMIPFIALANQMENTGDIMKEVLDNPSKMESLLSMAYNQPHLAQKALKSLSDSIKTNQTAKAEEAQARDPMSQIKSSTTSGNMEKSQHDMSSEEIRRLLVKKFK